MAILRMPLDYTAGVPQPVVLQPRRQQKMSNPQFYQQQAAPQPQIPTPDYNSLNQAGSAAQAAPAQPSSQEFIEQHLQRMAQRQAVPELDPGSRVMGPNMELVQPSNFETYYGRLAAIKEANQALGGAASARAAFQRMQLMQADSGGPTGSPTVGYKNPASQGSSGYGKAGSGLNLGNVSGVPSNPQANFKFAQNIAGNYGWNNQAELNAWYQLGMKESGWRNTAQNPTSTAYGIGQFLDSTWKGYGIAKTSDPAMQVEAMARYIRARYGSPSRALAFHRAHNWY